MPGIHEQASQCQLSAMLLSCPGSIAFQHCSALVRAPAGEGASCRHSCRSCQGLGGELHGAFVKPCSMLLAPGAGKPQP